MNYDRDEVHTQQRTLADDLRDGGYEGKRYSKSSPNSEVEALLFEENGREIVDQRLSSSTERQHRTIRIDLDEGTFRILDVKNHVSIGDQRTVTGAFIEAILKGRTYKMIVDLSDIYNARSETGYKFFGRPLVESPREHCTIWEE